MLGFINDAGVWLVGFFLRMNSDTVSTLLILSAIFYILMWELLTEGFHWRMTNQVNRLA